jgi:hypothetical protein
VTTALYAMPGLEPDFNLLNPSPTAPEIIGLAGYARSGKDTVAGIIHRLYGHTVLSFSDILREFLYAQKHVHLPVVQPSYDPDTPSPAPVAVSLNEVVDRYGWEGARERFPLIRDLQQTTGTEAGRNVLSQSLWLDAWTNRVQERGGNWVNGSVRFPNEAEAVKAVGGKVYRVVRPGIKAVNEHPSDTALDSWRYDDIIINDGNLIDLEGEVQRVLGEFG